MPGARCQMPDAIPGSEILGMCEVAAVLTLRLYGVFISHIHSGFLVVGSCVAETWNHG